MVFDPISIAIQLALVVASVILTARNIEVGKLDDISVDTGSYNRIIPRVYGTQLVVPQTIWIANNKLIEIKKKKKIIFGLGGSITTYKYFATFALAATNNKVQIRRVWANDTLVFDISNSANGGFSDEIINAANDGVKRGGLIGLVASALNLNLSGLNWEFKDGSLDQSISHIIKTVDGEAETPAYRGISYMALQFFPLKDFGNSIPQFKFEVVEVDNVDYSSTAVPMPWGIKGFLNSDTYDRLLAWGFSNNAQIIDVPTASIERIANVSGSYDVIFDGTIHYVKKYNAIIVSGGGPTSFGGGATMFDAASGRVIGFAQETPFIINYSTAVHDGVYWHTTTNDKVHSFIIDEFLLPAGAPVQDNVNLLSATGNGEINFNILAPCSNPRSFATTFSGNITQSTLYIHGSPGITINLDQLLGYSTRPGVGYSLNENAFIIVGDHGIHKFSRSGELLASNPRNCAENVMALKTMSEHNIAQPWFVTSAGSVIKVDLSSLEIIREITSAEIPSISLSHDVISLPRQNAIVVDTGNPKGTSWDIVYLDRVTQSGTTVQHIVEDLAQQIGYPLSRLDATAGTRTISGMIVAGDDARRSVDELLKITGYDLIEEDGKIKIVDRGNAPVMAIEADDLGTDQSDGKPYRLERTLNREADAPWKVELGFSDVDGDFESNLAIARRAIDAVETQTVLSVDTPIALDVDTAKTFAGKMLSQAHRERAGVSLSLPMVKYGRLSPGDVITVPDGADALNVKIIRASGAHVLEIKGVIDDPTGIDTLLIGTPRNVPSSSLNRIGVPSVIVVDSALPTDSVSANDGYGLSSHSILPGREIGPVDIIRSTDSGESFEFLDVTQGEPIVGIASAALVDIAQANLMDHVSAFSVNLTTAPSSATQQDLLDDETRNLIFVEAGDDWELMQYANVTDNGNGNYALSGFYRGLRGTEHLIGSHAAGDRVVFISEGYIRAGDLTHFQIPSIFAAIQTEDDDPITVAHTPQLRGLKPLSPAHLLIDKSGDDSVVSWTRRTRIGGAQLNGSDVPLSETSEAYEIDIVDGGGVAATKTSIATETYTYSVAEQITDLGTNNVPFTARVYQISAEFGRGTPSGLYFENPPADPLVFQMYFPSATSVADSSVNAHPITLNSGASITDEAVEFGGLQAAFKNGSTNGGAIIPNHPDFNFGSGPWTVEFVVNHDVLPVLYYDYFVKYNESGNNRELILRRKGNNVLSILNSSSGSSYLEVDSAVITMTPGQDHHIVFQGDGFGNCNMYFDGARVYDGPAPAHPIHAGTADVNIGVFPVAFNDWPGYIKWMAINRSVKYSGASINVPTGVYTSQNSNIVFQTSFPDASTVVDNSNHNHTINLLGGAAVSTAQVWAGQNASIDCTDLAMGLELPDSVVFIRGSGVWTYECMVFFTEDTAANLDIIHHWLNSSDRSFAVQRLTSKVWSSYHSENSSSFNQVNSAAAHPFVINQWTHIAVARHANGNVSMWQDGGLVLNGDPGIASYFDTFNDNPITFKFMTGPTSSGPKGYLGWAAMRSDDVYGEVPNILPPTQPYI